MVFKPRRTLLSRVLLLAATAVATLAGAKATAQGGRPNTVPGKILLVAQPGTAAADVQQLCAVVNPAAVTPLMLKDVYEVTLQAADATVAGTATAAAKLKNDGRVRWVNPEPAYRVAQAGGGPTAPVNDPMYPQQWALPLINMPQAWTLVNHTGDLPYVTVAVVDSGADLKHEDAIGQFDPGSYDFADNDPDVTADGADAGFDHGTSTSGVLFANTNNAKGIAGIDWQKNIKCLFLKIENKGSTTGYLDGAAIMNSYAYMAQNQAKYHIVACNMSYGRAGDPTDTSDPEYIGTLACANAGILMIAAAGNYGDTGNPLFLPADFPHVMSVAALDRNGVTTPYSEFGKVDIAAPGGNTYGTGVPENGVLLLKQNSKYTFEDGTSFAAPHVAGVAGLMMQIPGVTAKMAREALQTTANHSKLSSLPDAHYGYGILDAYGALLRVSVNVRIDAPQGVNASGVSSDPSGGAPAPIETLQPTITFTVSNVPLASLSVVVDPGTQNAFTLDQNFIAAHIVSGNYQGANPQYTVSFRHRFPNSAPYQHKIQVTGTNPNTSTTSTDTRFFSIQPHVIPAGLSFVSIPYYESASDPPTGAFRSATQLLDPNVTLYRWVTAPLTTVGGVTTVTGSYAVSGPKASDPNATFTPPVNMPTVDGTTTTLPPLGLGYFINSAVPITVSEYGTDAATTAFRIPLQAGWNMVGDPYNYSVPFNSMEVETTAGMRMTVGTAVDQGILLPYLYRYADGQYQFDTLPAGTFDPWQGRWVYVKPQPGAPVSSAPVAYLITTPVQIAGVIGRAASFTRGHVASRAVASVPRTTGAGSWALQIEAVAGNLHDAYNFVGETRSTGALSQALVPKPPKPSPYVNVGLTHQGAAPGDYAQDLQTVGGEHSWTVTVATDQPNANVTVTWPNVSAVPRGYGIVLTDTVTGQAIDVRHRSSFQYNSGATAGTRTFTLTAKPAFNGGRPVLTNIVVNPGRSGGTRSATPYEIGYTVSQDVRVEASILGVTGQTVAVVSPTRAVQGGSNQLVWNGRDSRGQSVPAGTYLLQLRAITSDNQVAREVRPLIVTGR